MSPIEPRSVLKRPLGSWQARSCRQTTHDDDPDRSTTRLRSMPYLMRLSPVPVLPRCSSVGRRPSSAVSSSSFPARYFLLPARRTRGRRARWMSRAMRPIGLACRLSSVLRGVRLPFFTQLGHWPRIQTEHFDSWLPPFNVPRPTYHSQSPTSSFLSLARNWFLCWKCSVITSVRINAN